MTKFLLGTLLCLILPLTATEPVARQPVTATGGAVIVESREASQTFTLDQTKVPAGANLAVSFFRKEAKVWIKKTGAPVVFTAADGVRYSEQAAFRFALVVSGRETTQWTQNLSTSMINWVDAPVITPILTNGKYNVSVTFTDPCQVESSYYCIVQKKIGGSVGFAILGPQSGTVKTLITTNIPAGEYRLTLSPLCLTEFGVPVQGYSPTFAFTIAPEASN